MLKNKILIGFFLVAVIFAVVGIRNFLSKSSKAMTVYHSKTCGCCTKWIAYLKENGFSVDAQAVDDMNSIKEKHGISEKLSSCHTAIIDGYVLEGHVPIQAIEKLLSEKPKVEGLAVPGMPMGSPGMEGSHNDTYDVVTFTKGVASNYMTFTGKHAH